MPLCIGHVHLKISDMKRSKGFYTKLLGFKLTETVGNYAFLTFGKKHHDLALQEIKNAKMPSSDTIGMYHFAIELKNIKELAELYFKLKENGINVSPVDHGISKALYFPDPDNNGIEVYVDTRQIRKKWKGITKIISSNELKKLIKKQ